MVLSAGGNTSFLNAMLGRQDACPSLFIGSLRRLHADLFTIVFTLEPVGSSHNIVMTIPPSIIDVDELNEERQSLQEGCANDAPLFAIFIGGDGAGFSYSTQDWQLLAKGMIAVSAETRCRWLLTTSRRTGKQAEQVLRSLIPYELLQDAVWYAEKPRPAVRLFLALASCVFVTSDSMSMLADAISSGRQTVALRPHQSHPDKRYHSALQGFQQHQYMQMLDFSDMASFSANADGAAAFALSQKEMMQKVKAALKAFSIGLT
jgi:mitochondrial fission protein ELM1